MATPSEAKTAEQNKKFETSIQSFCEVKNAVNAELEKFNAVCSLIEEKISSLDPEIIQDLNELLLSVQNCIDDGFSSLDLLGRGVTGLTSRVKQASAVWDKYRDQKTGTPFSGLVDDTNAVERRMLKLKEDVDKIQNQFASFEIEKKDSEHIEKNASMLILGADQQKINKVTDEIGRRVSRDAKKLLSLQQRINVLKYATGKYSSHADDSLNISLNSKASSDVDAITTEVRRLVLVVEKPDSEKDLVKDDLLDELDIQTALQNVLTVHQNRPNAIRKIIPKRLIVDPKLVGQSPVATPQRRANADQTLGQQLAAAKNSPLLSRSPATPAITKTLFGKSPAAAGRPSAVGTPVRVEAIMNAAKPTIQAAVAAAAPPPPPPPPPQPQVVPVDPQLPKSVVPPIPTITNTQDQSATDLSTNKAPEEPKSDKEGQKSEEEKSTAEAKKPAEAAVSTTSQPATVITTTTTSTVTPSSFSFTSSSGTDTQQKPSFFNTQPNTQPGTQPTASSFTFAPKTAEQSTTAVSATTGPGAFSFAPKANSSFGGGITASNQTASTGIFGPNTQSTTTSSFFGNNTPATTTTAPSQPTFTFTPKPAQPATGTSSFFTNQASQPKSGSFFTGSSTQSISAAKPAPIFSNANAASNDDGMEDDSANAASSFSFGGTGLGGAPQNKPGSAFGSLNWANVGQNKAFGSMGQQTQSSPATNQTQTQSKAFGTSAFGSGPSFGGGSAFGGGPAFGSGASSAFGQKTMFGGGMQNAAAPTTTGFSAFANKATSFGQLAQNSPQYPSAFSSQNLNSSFGSTSFGSPQNQSSAFTSFRK